MADFRNGRKKIQNEHRKPVVLPVIKDKWGQVRYLRQFESQ